MKKVFLVSILMVLVSLSSFAQAKPKVGVAIDMGLSIVAEVDRYNIVLGDTGVAVDYKIVTGKFDDTTPLTWYVAGGGWAGWDHGFGLRVPLGVTWFFAKRWDLYGQVQPVADFDNEFDFSVDAAVGVRFAF
ncbi:hypothetical protein [Colwellia echini]|uniref:Outer membrane protein beta-barrel domain-containing protein n=1 Tax=Colwellia echini TaxID=1982103 RepID=A0ABY3MW57_9GAMM|nr:hypothetical protein [Colwellia echini]TYK65381.1 hypothetical protein CWS31_010985 [Colwellia echini]